MYPLKNIAMLVFISCAKTMAARCSVVVPEVTVPKFEVEAVGSCKDRGIIDPVTDI